MIWQIGSCPTCSNKITIDYDVSQKRGLCHYFLVYCVNCDWRKTFSSSKEIPCDNRGRKPFDINVRSVMAFREIGRGHRSMQEFCSVMNMPAPMNSFAYENIITILCTAVMLLTSQESMQAAANDAFPESMHVSNDGVNPVTASFDGTWQRRGCASLNGVVTAVCQGKCIDIEALCKECKSCKYWETKKGTVEYDEWQLEHDCPVNHEGSAGSMEAAGAVTIFKRSVDINKLRYLKYRGDGDSKAYQDVVAADPYPGLAIIKSECVGHVQKRGGTRLRKMKDSMKGQKLSI